jgi:S-adenosyl methyltransferase
VSESPELDPVRPTPAGIYDYLLGGQHYSAADQAAAEQAVAMTPATRSEVIENRAFLRRAVRYLASRGLLDSPDTTVIVRDVRQPAEITGDPQTRRLIDWSRPVAVLMVSILHFIQDEVAGFLAGFDLVPPGLVTTVEWGTDRPPATGAGSILAAVGTVPAGEAPVS